MKMGTLGRLAFAGLLAWGLTAVAQAPAATSSSPVAGDWKAVVQRNDGPLHVILHIAADKTGALTASIDAVEMQASDVAVSNVVLKDTKLTFDVDQAPGSYAGMLNQAANEIDGTWTPQDGNAVAMNFTKDAGTPADATPATAPAADAPAAAPATAPADAPATAPAASPQN